MMNKVPPFVLVLILIGCDVSSIDENKAKEQLSVSSKAVVTEKEPGSPSVSVVPSNFEKHSDVTVNMGERRKTDKFKPKGLLSQKPTAIVKDLKDLLEKDKKEGTTAIEEILQDPEDEVRRETLALIYDEVVPVSETKLRDLALNDPNDRVRGTAALNIIDYGKPNEVREYLLEAVNDPNPIIRRQAQLRLNSLDRQNQHPKKPTIN